jgi:hypothetical protein
MQCLGNCHNTLPDPDGTLKLRGCCTVFNSFIREIDFFKYKICFELSSRNYSSSLQIKMKCSSQLLVQTVSTKTPQEALSRSEDET